MVPKNPQLLALHLWLHKDAFRQVQDKIFWNTNEKFSTWIFWHFKQSGAECVSKTLILHCSGTMWPAMLNSSIQHSWCGPGEFPEEIMLKLFIWKDLWELKPNLPRTLDVYTSTINYNKALCSKLLYASIQTTLGETSRGVLCVQYIASKSWQTPASLLLQKIFRKKSFQISSPAIYRLVVHHLRFLIIHFCCQPFIALPEHANYENITFALKYLAW